MLNYGNVTMDGEINAVNWMNESRNLLDGIYSTNHKITDTYIEANVPVIKKQLLLAGIRLLNVLNHYFKDFDKTPIFTKSEDPKISEISITDLDKNTNKMVKICSKVYSTKKLSSGITFLNIGDEYPNSPLTVVIFKDDLKNFKKNPEKYYKGKEICVTGRLILYKEKPEIIVKKEDEILVK